MPVKDMTFLKNAPLDSWLALDDEQTKVLAYASTLQELESKIAAEGFEEVVLWKTPPSKGRLAL